jgi:hypothetical protein
VAGNARKGTGGKRFYVWGRGERYWSVTTILKALPKDALKFWAASQVAGFAFDHAHSWLSLPREAAIDLLKREPLRFTGGRAEIGTALHSAAEAYALGKPLSTAPFEDEVRKMVGHFLRFLKAFQPRIIATEAVIYNRTQKYAGKFDLLVEISADKLAQAATPWDPPADHPEFVRLLLDYKTGKGVYNETALQLNAYAGAEFIGMPDGSEQPVPPLDGLGVVHITADGWELIPVRLDPEIFRAFLYVREVFRWLEVTSKEALGTPIFVDVPDVARAG